jgi:Phosphotransferase enzyme family
VRLGGRYGARVKSEPRDLDRPALADALEQQWGIAVARLDYVPVGFGTHHWNAAGADGSRWFVSGDDLQAPSHAGRPADDVFAALVRAFRTAAALHDDAGLAFVVAPAPSADGAVVRRLGERYAIRVEPFVAGAASPSGDFERPEDRRRVATLVGRVHAASDRIPAGLPIRDDLTLPGRAALEAALCEFDGPWGEGPFAEPARALLMAHAAAVRDRLRGYDGLARVVRERAGTWVVTHGEPHSANVIREPGGGARLVDWDTALVAPPERDLWMVLDDEMTGWDEYREAAGPVQLDREALGFYRERWALAEIAMYVAEFRRPHEDTADTAAAWQELNEYLT